MSRRRDPDKSVAQRVSNLARERRLSRDDAFTAYAMDRLLWRLGRSSQVTEFFLKGGVLVANLIDVPFRFTRDIDVLRQHGPPDPDDLRQRFRQVAAVSASDGIEFASSSVRAVHTNRDEDDYDGVKVFMGARVGEHALDLRIDVGFGDAVVPPARRIALEPFLPGDESARVLAYGTGPVVAEKVETLLSKFPVVRHRLKDLLDVVALADLLEFDGGELVASIGATATRRETRIDLSVLDDMRDELTGRRWNTDWATMLREKAVARPFELADAVARFDSFVRPLLLALESGVSPGLWEPGGPWRTGRELP